MIIEINDELYKKFRAAVLLNSTSETDAINNLVTQYITNSFSDAIGLESSIKGSNHRWTKEEEEICCEEFFKTYVVDKSSKDIGDFLEELGKKVPAVSPGSLRMKIQNIKYLAEKDKLNDTCSIAPLSKYSSQCEVAFEKVKTAYISI